MTAGRQIPPVPAACQEIRFLCPSQRATAAVFRAEVLQGLKFSKGEPRAAPRSTASCPSKLAGHHRRLRLDRLADLLAGRRSLYWDLERAPSQPPRRNRGRELNHRGTRRDHG